MTGSIWTLRSRPEPKLFPTDPPQAPLLFMFFVLSSMLSYCPRCSVPRGGPQHAIFKRTLCLWGDVKGPQGSRAGKDHLRPLLEPCHPERPRGLLALGPTPEAGLPAAPSVPHVRFGLPASEARDSLQDSGAPSTGERPKAGSGKAEGPCSPRPPQPPNPPTHHWM